MKNKLLSVSAAITSLALTTLAGADTPSQVPRLNFWTPDNIVEAIHIKDGVLFIGGAFTTLGANTGPFTVLNTSLSQPQAIFPQVNGEVHAVESDGAGGWIIGGTFDLVGGETRKRIAHILSDGSVADWDPGIDGGDVMTILLDGDTVYFGGHIQFVADEVRNGGAAVDLNTGELLDWHPDVVMETDRFVDQIQKLGDTVYLSGYFNTIGGEARNRIAAVDAENGELLPWNPAPNNSGVGPIVVTPNAIYVGGNFNMIGGAARSNLAALDPTTGDALPLNVAPDAAVTAIAVDGDSLFIGGSFNNVEGAARQRLAEINLVTEQVTDWNPGASGNDGWNTAIYDIEVDGDQVVIGGSFTMIGGAARKHVAVIDRATGQAMEFGTDFDSQFSTYVDEIALGSGQIAAGGKFQLVGTSSRTRCAAIDLETGALLPWNPAPNSFVRKFHSIGDTLYVGGAYTEIAGVTQKYLAAFDLATMEFIPEFNAGFLTHTGWVSGLDDYGDTLFASGEFQQLTGGTHFGLVALDKATGQPRSWDLDANQRVHDILVHEPTGRLYVGGNFTKVTQGQVTRNRLAAFDASTGALLNFTPNVANEVFTLAATGTTLYIGGHFFDVNNQSRWYLAAFSIDTGFLLPWDPHADDPVNDLLIHRDEVIAAGDFDTIGSEFTPNLAAIDPETGIASSTWEPEPSTEVLSLAAADDLLVAGGFFQSFDQIYQVSYLALFDYTALTNVPTISEVDVILGSLLSGGIPEIETSDDQYLRTRSTFGFSAIEPELMVMELTAVNAESAPTEIDLIIESRINHPNGTATIRVRSFTANQWQTVGSYPIGMSETTETIEGIATADRVSGDGEMRLQIKHVVAAVFSALGFDSSFDLIQIQAP